MPRRAAIKKGTVRVPFVVEEGSTAQYRRGKGDRSGPLTGRRGRSTNSAAGTMYSNVHTWSLLPGRMKLDKPRRVEVKNKGDRSGPLSWRRLQGCSRAGNYVHMYI